MTHITASHGRELDRLTFVRWGGDGAAYGPFENRAEAMAWIELKGENPKLEGATFKIYEVRSP